MLSYLPWLWLFSFDYLRYNYYKCMVTFTHYFLAKAIMLINRRGNIYVAYDITKLNVYTKGKRTRYKISSNIRITNVQSCNALIFLWLKQNWIHDGKFGIPYPPHCCACPKQGPGFQSRDLFYGKEWRWRWLFALLKLLKLLTITYYYSIFFFLCRTLNIIVFPFFIFSFDLLTIVKQSLVTCLMACNSFKYWLKSPIIKTVTISQLCPSV